MQAKFSERCPGTNFDLSLFLDTAGGMRILLGKSDKLQSHYANGWVGQKGLSVAVNTASCKDNV